MAEIIDLEEINGDGPKKKFKFDSSALGNANSTDSPGSCSTGSESPASVQSPPTPMPHTPMFSPCQNNSPSDSSSSTPGHSSAAANATTDLSENLHKIGWRRFWSEREKRFYYFNKFNHESRWDLPTISSEQQNLHHATPSTSTAHHHQHQHHQQQNLHNTANTNNKQQHHQPPPPPQIYKNFVPSDEWDVNSVATNVKMPERIPFDFYPPHPDVEILRVNALVKLRQYLSELCQTKEGIDVPVDSFQRWLMERKSVDKGRESVFPSNCTPEISPSLTKDLERSLPVKVPRFNTIPEARKWLSKYAEAAKKIAETRGNINPENRKLVKWHCQSTFEWLRGSQFNSKFEDYNCRYRFLNGRCQSIIMEAIKPNVDFICSKIYGHCRDQSNSILEEHRKMLETAGVPVSDDPLPPPKNGTIVHCYSAQLRYRWQRMPEVQMEQTKDDLWVKLTYKNETLKIVATHFYKLEQMYKHNSFDDNRKFDQYLARVWCVLKRYQCLFGPNQWEGSKLHLSLPRKVFETLHDEFAVSFECFASPLNSYFRQYCSPYADADGYFGSRGSFFDFHPVEGSFEANPPHCESIIDLAIDRFEYLLDHASGPMSFVVFLPDWNDPKPDALIKIGSSRYKRAQVTVSSQDCYLKHGAQHLMPNILDVYIRPSSGILIFVLQNEKAISSWPADDLKMQKLSDCFSLI